MYPDAEAPYLGTFVKDTVCFFGSTDDVIYPGNMARDKKIGFYFSIYKDAWARIPKSDLIVFHYPLFFFPLVFLARILRKQVNLVYHGGEFMGRPSNWPGSTLLRSIIFLANNFLADHIYVPTRFVAKAYFQRWSQKLKVWYSGGIRMSRRPLRGATREFQFAFFGRRGYVKGQDCYLQALQLLDRRIPKGAGLRCLSVCRETESLWSEQLDGLSIIHLPAMPQAQVLDSLEQCRFAVIPSRVESLCLLALEAASCGAIVIARKLPAIQETLGGRAIYFDKDDELIDALESAMSLSVHHEDAIRVQLWEIALQFDREKLFDEFKLNV